MSRVFHLIWQIDANCICRITTQELFQEAQGKLGALVDVFLEWSLEGGKHHGLAPKSAP